MTPTEIQETIDALVYTVKEDLPLGKDTTRQRIIIQDFIVALNRRGLVDREAVMPYINNALSKLGN